MPQLSIEQAFQAALAHHQAGQLAQAEQLYRQILDRQPNHAGASLNLGILAHQVGRNEIAVQLLRYAITLKPNWPEALSSLGEVLRVLGQVGDAIAAFHQAIACKPSYSAAHYNLGNALKDDGRLDEAIASYRRATTLNPRYLKAHVNLGVALQDAGRLHEAIISYRQAIAIEPNSSVVLGNLGGALKDRREFAEAVAVLRRAVALDPGNATAQNNLGVALKAEGKLNESIDSCRRAITFQPEMYEAHSNLGNALKDAGRLDEAIAAHRQAIALKPSNGEAYNNLGASLWDKGEVDECIATCRQAIAADPDFADAHKNLAMGLLARGEFQEGWEEYEWRWKCREFPSPPRNFTHSLWDGGPLEGKTLLVHAEQGLGDTIQFVRYLPIVQQSRGKVVLECQAELCRLLQSMAGEWRIVAGGQPLPAFDVHCPMLSLPRAFGTTLATVPGQVRYLHAEAETAGKWRDRLAGDAGLVKVGLAWAGSKGHKNDRNRSIALSAFAPLGRLHGVRFHSLQKTAPAEGVNNPPEGLDLIDWTDEFEDFADTAAFIANLDLVITVDTAVAHLAGAMGKAVWVLLPFAPDWRWLLGREDSPWYPTMRLFRQPCPGEWESVMEHLTRELPAWIDRKIG